MTSNRTTPIDQTFSAKAKEALRDLQLRFRRASAHRRALPGFLIIGAQKAGTTSLYDDLLSHPQVEPAFRKELHFFNTNPLPSVTHYRAQFPKQVTGRITGEATPYYLFHPAVPQRVHECLPDVKLIVMLRDPVARAWSHYHHERAAGYEPLGFDEAIAAEPDRLRAATPGSLAHKHHTYLARGRYAEQIERWFALFDRKRFLFIRSEDYFKQGDAVYAETLAFLGLDPHERIKPAWSKRGKSSAKISDAQRDRLQAYFQPHNEKLLDLLGERFAW